MKLTDNPLRGEDVRQRNEKLILQTIQSRKRISQSEIVNLTGLKPPTVLRIFSYLEMQGLIEITKYIDPEKNDRKGRKPAYYLIKADAHYVIGVELWSKQVSVVVVDFAKQPVYTKSVTDDSIEWSEELYNVVSSLIQEAISALSLDSSSILGIGIGAPGRVKVDTGEIIFYSRIKRMENFPLGKRLETDFSIPVLVTNNASVLAMNAFRRKMMSRSKSLLTILIRSGVGGAYIYDGKILTPQKRTAVEFGHVSVDINGRKCACGSQGCLETYLSDVALKEDSLKELGIDSLDELDRLAGEKNEHILEFIEKRGVILSRAAQDLYRIFAPDSVLIITRYMNIARIYAEHVQQILNHDTFRPKDETVQVTADLYDPVEACRGAADLIFEKYFS